MSASSSVRKLPIPLIPDYMEERILHYYERQAVQEKKAREGARSVAHLFTPAEIKAKQQAKVLAIMRGELSFDTVFPEIEPLPAQPRGIVNLPRSESLVQLWNAAVSPHRLVLANHPRIEDSPNRKGKSCYEIMREVDNFFRREFKRAPVLNQNRLMKAVAQDPLLENQCFWDPEREAMYIGDWDPEFFNLFFDKIDIITHEFGHAQVQYSSGFEYIGESGALDEHIADVFGIMHKHYKLNVLAESEETSWLIGENVLKNPEGIGTALRSMKEPGKAFIGHGVLGDDEQIAHVRDMNPQKWTDDKDDGGVHVYSGIPNHAFYLTATKMGGFSWKEPGQIWMSALLQAKEEDDFVSFASRTCEQAKLLYGTRTEEIVAQAWHSVGVDLRRSLSTQRETNKHDGLKHRQVVSHYEERKTKGFINVRPNKPSTSTSCPVTARICTVIVPILVIGGGIVTYLNR